MEEEQAPETNWKELADEYKDTLQRVQAEFENYKKREIKEVQSEEQRAKRSVVASFLPLLDSFTSAIDHIQNEDDKKGVVLLHDQLHTILTQLGLEYIETANKHFDPYLHEVLMQDNGEEGMILEELQAGYLLDGEVLRHSKVKVGKSTEG